jgi:hypothetical protein
MFSPLFLLALNLLFYPKLGQIPSVVMSLYMSVTYL